MDTCHASTCEYLDSGGHGAIENVEMLELYHNGPCWGRILWLNATITYEQALKEMLEKKEEAVGMQRNEITNKIVELAKEGKSVEEIMAATDSTKIQVKNAINRAKMKGELPYAGPKKLITRAAPRKAAEKAMEAVTAAIEKPVIPVDYIIADDTPAAAGPIVENAPAAPQNSDFIELGLPPHPAAAPEAAPLPAALDVAKLHKTIDLVARFPELSESLLKSCDEIETAAKYQLALVAEIREALSA